MRLRKKWIPAFFGNSVKTKIKNFEFKRPAERPVSNSNTFSAIISSELPLFCERLFFIFYDYNGSISMLVYFFQPKNIFLVINFEVLVIGSLYTNVSLLQQEQSYKVLQGHNSKSVTHFKGSIMNVNIKTRESIKQGDKKL